MLKQIEDKGTIADSDLENLCVTLTAHMQMLQSEHTVNIVEGTGVSRETVSMFRFLSKNSNFTSADTIALENATRISLAANLTQKQDNNNSGYRRGGGNRFQSRGHYNGNNRYNGRGGYHGNNNRNNSDAFDNSVNSGSKP